MSLQFLRPLALPRPTTIRYFLGVARLSTNPISSRPINEATSTSSSTPSQTTSAAVPNQPYWVSRTPSKNLPVYLLAKAGGNLKQTKIRKIEGDIMKLKEQLEEAFSNKQIRVNQLTKQIIIKGWHKQDVEKFLEERHF
ncbi:hypothetical protein DSL72_000993 [Monilinia vaccinii-corymbosi]|uniref:Large ribosomal subunit protein mL49 n=1 Tax=Monilinia vaccinii-corymbosi TaxID=61207 RepID=A0A8A3P8Y5_9HELO|nr:hypothetical protein DSL72_000993 [Monilinia vaccinii-corymbosi]